MIQILRQIPVLSLTAVQNCTLNIHIEDFQLTGGYRMVSPETPEYLDVLNQIAAKEQQVNTSTGATRILYLAELAELRALEQSLLVKDEGECIVRLRYSAINPEGTEIPFVVDGLQNNFVFYVSDLNDIIVDPQANEYLTMREKSKRYVLQTLKNLGFLGLADNEYSLS
jgi:hypothetical protein